MQVCLGTERGQRGQVQLLLKPCMGVTKTWAQEDDVGAIVLVTQCQMSLHEVPRLVEQLIDAYNTGQKDEVILWTKQAR